jgi:pimeloyl-ACP methyl ester carboxylesterase
VHAAGVAALAARLEKARLWVLDNNPRARAFYQRHGWQLDGTEARNHDGTDMAWSATDDRCAATPATGSAPAPHLPAVSASRRNGSWWLMLRRIGSMFAVNGDVKVAFDDLGPAAGRPLLMIMGMAASRFWWPPGLLTAVQATGFRPIIIDLRDTGESTRMSAAYRAEDLTDDAVAVLDALHLPTAHLFGLSFGGLVAQRLALRHPDRVRTLTTFATGSSDASMLTVALRYLRWGTQVKLLRLTRRAGSDTDHGIAIMRAAGYPDGDALARAAVARDSEHGTRSFRDLAAQSRQIRARWSGPPLAVLRCPALVICGDADPVMRVRASQDTAAAIRGARLVILPGIGHVPPPAAWTRIAHEMRTLADN